MDTEVALKNVHVFTNKAAYDAYIASNTIEDEDIVLVGDYALVSPDLDWKEAFKGEVITLNTVICTLPSIWREAVIKYDWASTRASESFMLIPRIGLDTTKSIVPSDSEIYITIDSTNQIRLTDRGDGGDAMVKAVYYR